MNLQRKKIGPFFCCVVVELTSCDAVFLTGDIAPQGVMFCFAGQQGGLSGVIFNLSRAKYMSIRPTMRFCGCGIPFPMMYH